MRTKFEKEIWLGPNALEATLVIIEGVKIGDEWFFVGYFPTLDKHLHEANQDYFQVYVNHNYDELVYEAIESYKEGLPEYGC